MHAHSSTGKAFGRCVILIIARAAAKLPAVQPDHQSVICCMRKDTSQAAAHGSQCESSRRMGDACKNMLRVCAHLPRRFTMQRQRRIPWPARPGSWRLHTMCRTLTACQQLELNAFHATKCTTLSVKMSGLRQGNCTAADDPVDYLLHVVHLSVVHLRLVEPRCYPSCWLHTLLIA